MPSLTVLSPHQDDAALSLAATIGAAARRGHSVRIINCFTVSDYAPHSTARTLAEIAAVRNAEDREFATRVGTGIEVVDLGMEDAPIRLGCSVGEVRRRKVGRREREDAAAIAAKAAGMIEGLVLAPLALGTHIDHLVAREAGIRLAREGRAVAFYEDLPYAGELRECCILRAADEAARRVGSKLAGAVMRDGEAASRKRFAIEAYQSQLARTQFDAVIEYGQRRGGERVWGTSESRRSIPALEGAEIETGFVAAVWGRRLQCAAHAAARRAGAVVRHATELISRGGGGVNAPQPN